MDKRICSNLRLLAAASVLVVLCVSSVARTPHVVGNLYVRVRTADCGMTKLIIKITDVAPLPGNIVLSLRNEKTGSEELEGKSIELNNGEYAWTGPIQIGDFTATVMISRSK